MDWAVLIGAIIYAGASIYNTAKTNKTNRKNVAANNKVNLELAEKQNDWNTKQWERENEYNSPENQLQLMKDAGINPISSWSSVDSSADSLVSADMANQQAATASPADLSGLSQLGALFNDSKRVQNETKLAESQVAKNYAETDQAKANTSYIHTLEGVGEAQKNLYIANTNETNQKILNLKQDLANAISTNRKINAEALEAMARGEMTRKQITKLEKFMDAELGEINSRTAANIAAAHASDASVGLIHAETTLTGAKALEQKRVNGIVGKHIMEFETAIVNDYAMKGEQLTYQKCVNTITEIQKEIGEAGKDWTTSEIYQKADMLMSLAGNVVGVAKDAFIAAAAGGVAFKPSRVTVSGFGR